MLDIVTYRNYFIKKSKFCPGNVEILHNGKWGNICDDEWDHLEATVVCRQLGFNGAVEATTNGRFGQARSKKNDAHLYIIMYCRNDPLYLSE